MDIDAREPRHVLGSALNRRRFLQLGVAGLGAAALSVGARARASFAASPAVAPAASDLPLLGGPEYPIGFFWPPPREFTTSERYAEIAEAGFTWVLGVASIVDFPINDTMLRLCEEHGLLGVPTDFRIYAIRDYPRDQWQEIFTTTLAEYRKYPAFAGLHLRDEPQPDWYPSMAEVMRMAREQAPDVLFHTNAAPWHMGERLVEFVETIQPHLLSFDNYPLMRGRDNPGFFEQWGQVRELGLQYDLPTWVYIQSVATTNLRNPTPAELLWQVNVSLAYGCKGIQYFTYWTPESYSDLGPGGLITLEGERTERYYAAKDINTQWLARVGRQLKPLTSETVAVANLLADAPPGLPRFQPDGYVRESWGDPVIVSRFADPSDPDHRWLFVANYSHDDPSATRINLGSLVRGRGVAKFNAATERFEEVPPPQKRLDVALAAGEAHLYRLPVRRSEGA
ncbi:MAG TPA: hypothetical protein VIL34_17240 [Actinopolymorphaceae bacterium]